jgi:SAM-dependent methyltransferase
MTKQIRFEGAPLRGRFEAWLLDSTSDYTHAQHGERKSDVIGAMRGTIVELGPGSGANMRYYAPGVKVIGIEPNPAMHERLRAHASEHDVDLEIRTLRGEALDVDDASVDAVVATLVLCGVSEPSRVLSEITRVLRPGGTYFFLEHVGARHGSPMRRFQRLVNRPHRWVFNGCEVNRDTADLIEASGFSSVQVDQLRNRPGFYMPDFITGTAVR